MKRGSTRANRSHVISPSFLEDTRSSRFAFSLFKQRSLALFHSLVNRFVSFRAPLYSLIRVFLRDSRHWAQLYQFGHTFLDLDYTLFDIGCTLFDLGITPFDFGHAVPYLRRKPFIPYLQSFLSFQFERQSLDTSTWRPVLALRRDMCCLWWRCWKSQGWWWRSWYFHPFRLWRHGFRAIQFLRRTKGRNTKISSFLLRHSATRCGKSSGAKACLCRFCKTMTSSLMSILIYRREVTTFSDGHNGDLSLNGGTRLHTAATATDTPTPRKRSL